MGSKLLQNEHGFLKERLLNATIFVSNLPLSLDSSALEDMFTRVGDVRQALIERDPMSGASLGRGTVEMSTREEAENCVLHFNSQPMNGQRLAVFLPGAARVLPKRAGRRNRVQRTSK